MNKLKYNLTDGEIVACFLNTEIAKYTRNKRKTAERRFPQSPLRNTRESLQQATFKRHIQSKIVKSKGSVHQLLW